MKFATQYVPNKIIPEKNSGKSFVENVGYISAEKRISNLMLAGQRLRDYRNDQFDFPDEKSIDDNFTDPTRSKNFDMADATQLSYQTERNIINSKKAVDMALKSSQDAQKAQDELKKPE